MIKRRAVNFTRLYALNKRKVSRQTFVNYLQEALVSGLIITRKQGRNTYYSLAGNYSEEELLSEYLKLARANSVFLPNEFIDYV